jgi:glutathione S-transferase
MLELYQFRFSHYCIKARWALEHKRIAYRERNLLPGAHIKVARALIAPARCASCSRVSPGERG